MKLKPVTIQKAVLLAAGALLILVGVSILAAPAEFYAANRIAPGANPSLLYELEAPGLVQAAGVEALIGLACLALRQLSARRAEP